MNRFAPRPPLPLHPHRALLFSNYAQGSTHLPAVTEACRQTGLDLDVVGAGMGRSEARPEGILGHYDLVFAKAKAAMEAMAVGTAVVLCDYSGAGPMVTGAEFDTLRAMNFGFQALREPLDPAPLIRQIRRYDARDAACVQDRIRASAGLDQTVTRLLSIYQAVTGEDQAVNPGRDAAPAPINLFRHRIYAQLVRHWNILPLPLQSALKRIPGFRSGLLAVTHRIIER